MGEWGDFPSLGVTFQEGSKAGQEGRRRRRVFPPCQSPWWEGDFIQKLLKKKISSGFGLETQLAPGETKIIQSGVEKG